MFSSSVARSPQPIGVTDVWAFGWLFHRHVMSPGARLVVVSTKEIDRAEAPNRTFYVRGAARFGLADGTRLPDRVPGMFSADRPNTPRGVSVHEAVEEFEFWCCNSRKNGGALPDLTPLRFPDGGHLVGRQGARVLVCAGRIGAYEAGSSFVAEEAWPQVCPATYALVIGGDRD